MTNPGAPGGQPPSQPEQAGWPPIPAPAGQQHSRPEEGGWPPIPPRAGQPSTGYPPVPPPPAGQPYGGEPPAPQPKRSWVGRHKILTGLGVLVLLGGIGSV